MDYKRNLHFLYWLMLASEDLLKKAIERAPLGRTRDYFFKHLNEERGHAAWLKGDLERMGVQITLDFEAAAIAGSQLYIITYDDPRLLLGYMHVLESWPNQFEVLERLEAEYGPLKCLRYHMEHDPAHAKDVAAEIAALPEAVRLKTELNSRWVKGWLLMVFSQMEKR